MAAATFRKKSSRHSAATDPSCALKGNRSGEILAGFFVFVRSARQPDQGEKSGDQESHYQQGQAKIAKGTVIWARRQRIGFFSPMITHRKPRRAFQIEHVSDHLHLPIMLTGNGKWRREFPKLPAAKKQRAAWNQIRARVLSASVKRPDVDPSNRPLRERRFTDEEAWIPPNTFLSSEAGPRGRLFFAGEGSVQTSKFPSGTLRR